MRKTLDRLYGIALACACLAMVAIATLVFVQVAGRVIDRGADLAGMARLGISVPSLAEFGGYLFAASTFLALPATLRAGVHVRVTLALKPMPPTIQKGFTLLVIALGFALAAYATYYLGAQSWTALERGSVSYGLIPIPVWIPQAFMTAGLGIFAISLVDEFLTTLSGGTAAFRQAELERGTGEGAN